MYFDHLLSRVIFRVLASDSWRKGSNTPSLKTLVVDEERMRPVWDIPQFWVSALSFLQYFDTVGWVTGRTAGPYKTCATYLQRFRSRTNGKTTAIQRTQVNPENDVWNGGGVVLQRIQCSKPRVDGGTDEEARETPDSHGEWCALSEVGQRQYHPVVNDTRLIAVDHLLKHLPTNQSVK